MSDYGTGPIDWDKAAEHIGHSLTVATYGNPADPANISLECSDCSEVITDTDLIE